MDNRQVLDHWPYCADCHEPFEFDNDAPFAHCKCGTTEWGNPRPAPWVPNPKGYVVGQTRIDMVLYCPRCDRQHIDKPEEVPEPHMMGDRWTNPPHKSHLCDFCGCIWRPADVCTNGVARITSRGLKDNWPEIGPIAIPTSTVKRP